MILNILLYIFSGIIASLPVLVCREFYSKQNFDFLAITIFAIIIYSIWFLITILLCYYIYNNLKIGQFYVIIKLLEIGITVLASIFLYNEEYNIYKYIGFLFAFVSIILVSIK